MARKRHIRGRSCSTHVLYFQFDKRDETRFPAPIYIGQLMLRFGRLNLRILRLETPTVRLAVSKYHAIRNTSGTWRQLHRYILKQLYYLYRQQIGSFPLYCNWCLQPRARSRNDEEHFDRNELIELQALFFGNP